jgi:eukaryotic-like serine/threonine-protein kinase
MSGLGGAFRSALLKGTVMAPFDVKRWNRASKHLDDLLDLSAEEREASIDALSLLDPDVAVDVQTLLAAHRRLTSEGFLEADLSITPAGPSAGLAVGPYVLTESIGHGGMGSVWRADRSDGRFKGSVAVKLLNPELIGKSSGDRFTREGQILAKLTHPNIARLLDAGLTATGQPFLVLELVDGSQIDRYCDAHGTRVNARLLLFLDVLAAVAHAHANLIVHRDLKPSNVLVTTGGAVKLLDFGIAKLLDAESGEDTPMLLTRGGGALTPKYAAPEQVTAGAITTATDVYALGVMLYELLTGVHPVGSPESAAGLVRAIVENEPLRPSDVAPQDVRAALRGDLETIIGKAMRKRPSERYASVVEFADDIRRYMQHQPISARPDSARYRAGKFMRRHRGPLTVAALVLLAVGGLVSYYTYELRRARDRAELQAVKSARMNELLTSVLRGADPFRTPDGREIEPTVRSLLDGSVVRIKTELADRPDLQAEMFNVIGQTYERMGLHDTAMPLLEQALVIGRALPERDLLTMGHTLKALGVLKRRMGDHEGALPLLRESLELRRSLMGNDHNDVAISLVELARLYEDRGRDAEAHALSIEALDIRIRVLGHDHRETATSKSDVGRLLWRQGRLDESERLLRESLATFKKVLGDQHPNTASAMHYLALALHAKNDFPAAEDWMRRSMDIDGRAIGTQHPSYANSLNSLSIILLDQGRIDEAQAAIDQSLAIGRKTMGEAHNRVLGFRLTAARLMMIRKDFAQAEAEMRSVLPAREKLYQAGDWRIGQVKALLGAALAGQGRFDEARSALDESLRMLKDVPGQQARDAAFARAQLAALP